MRNTSEILKQRLEDANIRYWAGDNISEIMQKAIKKVLLKNLRLNLKLYLTV